MGTIGSSQAKDRLSELLAKAERGEEIVITRRGRPVAKLVPIATDHNIGKARGAMRCIRTLAQQMMLDPLDFNKWKNYRNHGRR